jgi:hypothetical protein
VFTLAIHTNTQQQIHTHYDNLSVTHNAPLEVINAAKNALLNKYSEKNYPDDAEARRLRLVIKSSYHVLSDSVRRKSHDDWVLSQQTGSMTSVLNENNFSYDTLPLPALEVSVPLNSGSNDQIYFGVLMTGIAIAGLVLLVYL